MISSSTVIRNYFGGSYRKLGIKNNLTSPFSASALDIVRPRYYVRGNTKLFFTSQKDRCITITNTSRLFLFSEVLTVLWEL